MLMLTPSVASMLQAESIQHRGREPGYHRLSKVNDVSMMTQRESSRRQTLVRMGVVRKNANDYDKDDT